MHSLLGMIATSLVPLAITALGAAWTLRQPATGYGGEEDGGFFARALVTILATFLAWLVWGIVR